VPQDLLAGYSVARLARLIARDATRRVAELLGLTLAEWRVLLTLDGRGAVQLDEIARRALLETSHASIAASALAQKGLVERGSHPGDRRRVRLRRTAAGTRAVSRYMAATSSEREALWGVLTKAECRVLVRLLGRLIDAAVAGGYEEVTVRRKARARD
jgi:DNA-binding MarR family transcriptional regulator